MRTFVGLLLFIFVVLPLGITSLLMVSLSSWILDRDFYTAALNDPALYEAILTEEIPANLREIEIEGIGQVPGQAITAGLREVVTPEYLRGQANAIVDDVFALIDGNDFTIDVTLDLSPVKEQLSGEGGERFAEAIAQNLPTCETGQEPRDNPGDLPRCIDENQSVEEVQIQILDRMPVLLESLPDTLLLSDTENTELNAEFSNIPFEGRFSVRTIFQSGITVLTIVAALFWFLAALIGGVGQRGRLFWLSSMLFFPAALVLLIGIGVVSEPVLDVIRRGSATWALNGIQTSGEFQAATLDVARTFASRIGNGFLVVGGVALGISVLLGLLAAISPGRMNDEKRKTVTVSSAS